jgi:maltooligosyltrehalose trehalohydrolase
MTRQPASASHIAAGGPSVLRRLPFGAELQPDGSTHFRVWAPMRRRVEVVIEGASSHRETIPLSTAGGCFEGVGLAPAGTRYRYRLDGEDPPNPDPASRFQPEGPHGPSEVIDPSTFAWTDQDWRGISIAGQVIYEMHIGTFTREGTFAAAIPHLKGLAQLGVTVLEIMPIAEFAGRFGWGYDGVDLYAPTRLYGRPDDVRRFVDQAHAAGLGVILDVVYNHFGPDGCFLQAFSDRYFREEDTEWGRGIRFDGEDSGAVREFFIANAGYWIDEFHMDGLRLDATQSIQDSSSEHVVTAIGRSVRAKANHHSTIVVAEDEPQRSELVRSIADGGCGLDAIWNDDFHHTATVALTGRREAYYTDYHGSPQELLSAVKWGFLYQGQLYSWQGKRRGTPSLDLPRASTVLFLQNHDQVANSAKGLRGHQLSNPGRWRAMTALLLLAPGTPMLFQGQEFAASTPFLFFADHHPELAHLVREGRREFLSQFVSLNHPDIQYELADPGDAATFERCKLDDGERHAHVEARQFHADLLRLRRDEPAFRAQGTCGIDGAVLGQTAFAVRFFGSPRHERASRMATGLWAPRNEAEDRLLLVNLGAQLTISEPWEPLLAPPVGHAWALDWSSDDPRYGGSGTPEAETVEGWCVPGECTVALKPAPIPQRGFRPARTRKGVGG